VGAADQVGDHVGSIVKKTFFAQYPGFRFNVCFSVGPMEPASEPLAFVLGAPVLRDLLPQGLGARGTYGDPTSIWFNVFAGYYQLDAPKPAWSRPFGYEVGGGKPTIRAEDVVPIGKADWNYFSNYMYGVPEDCIAPFDAIDLSRVKAEIAPTRTRIGERHWDLLRLDGVEVVSAYESAAPHARRLVNNSLYTKLWQAYFGGAAPREGHEQSFPGASMQAALYMSYTEDDDFYRTVLFGGTVNTGFTAGDNATLLDAELSAVRTVIEQHSTELGFPGPA